MLWSTRESLHGTAIFEMYIAKNERLKKTMARPNELLPSVAENRNIVPY
jgi:hypothetical protein